MKEFTLLAKKINNAHEVTNPRVRASLDVLTSLTAGPLIADKEYKAMGTVKFLNRKGLLKYKEWKVDENKIIIYPTLLFYYLTLVMKYDIYTVYSESIKLYQAVGDKLNDVKYI